MGRVRNETVKGRYRQFELLRLLCVFGLICPLISRIEDSSKSERRTRASRKKGQRVTRIWGKIDPQSCRDPRAIADKSSIHSELIFICSNLQI